MQCPRCQTALESVSLNVGQAFLCPQCEGVWFDDPSLDAFLNLAEETLQTSALGVSLEAEDHGLSLKAPIDCPHCQQRMTRFQYAGDSRVYLDVCPQHGVWLDDGELGDILEYLTIRQGVLDDLPGGAALIRIPPSFFHWLGRWFRGLRADR